MSVEILYIGTVILVSLISIFYYLRTGRELFSETLLLNVSIITFNGYNFLGMTYHIGNFTLQYVTIGIDILFVSTCYLLFEYHDRFVFSNPKSIWKLLYLFFSSATIGIITLSNLQFTYQISNNNKIIFLFYLIGILALARILVYFNFESRLLPLYYKEKSKLVITLWSITLLLIIIIFSIIFFNIEDGTSVILLGLSLSNIVFGFIFLSYSFDPIRAGTMPLGIVWFGALDQEGKIIYSRSISRKNEHRILVEKINEEMNRSFHSLNHLFSEALELKLEIKHLHGEKYSLYNKSTRHGNLVLITEEKLIEHRNYDYDKLLTKLTKLDSSPFVDIKIIKKNPEQAVSFMDQKMWRGIPFMI